MVYVVAEPLGCSSPQVRSTAETLGVSPHGVLNPKLWKCSIPGTQLSSNAHHVDGWTAQQTADA
jgi:hypothetical protein